ncbi:MAG: M48 family metallopeptidase [Desulfuromonadales bacterium]|nr:M48 family metallopeptidase [Desulfuromonadales bacterium]
MTPMTDDGVVFNGVVIPFSYCRSRRKTLGMTVRPDKLVMVRAPLRTPLGQIRDFVARKGAWIIKVWQRFDSLPPKSTQSYGRDASILFQGRKYPLRIQLGAREAVSLHEDALVVQTPQEHSGEKLHGLIEAWYRQRAVELFSERLQLCHGSMRAEGFPLPAMVIRSMKSRWGSYSYRTGRISLNLQLIKAPEACLDYVIIHELCHIRVPNHGPRFWRLVSRYAPDHTGLRKQLRSCVIL